MSPTLQPSSENIPSSLPGLNPDTATPQNAPFTYKSANISIGPVSTLPANRSSVMPANMGPDEIAAMWQENQDLWRRVEQQDALLDETSVELASLKTLLVGPGGLVIRSAGICTSLTRKFKLISSVYIFLCLIHFFFSILQIVRALIKNTVMPLKSINVRRKHVKNRSKLMLKNLKLM